MSRKAIRDAAKAAIETAMTGTLQEVSIGRRIRLSKGRLPAACIYTDSELAEPAAMGAGRPILRTLDLAVKIFVTEGMDFSWDDLSEWTDSVAWFDGVNSDLLDDQLDAIAYVIEDVLATSANLGLDYVLDIFVSSWEVEAEEDDADRHYLAGTLTFTVQYTTNEAV